MHNIEILATITGLIQGILVMFNKKCNWIFQLISVVCLTLFSFNTRLYADGLENCVYLGISIWGLICWYGLNKKEDKVELQVSVLKPKERLLYLICIVVLFTIIYNSLLMTNDANPLLDAITTSIGIIATYLMAVKKLETWILWFIVDIVRVYMYYTLEIPALWLTILNFFWIFMAIGSFVLWYRELKKVAD